MSNVIFLIQDGIDFSKLENEIKRAHAYTIYSLDYESHKLLEKKKIAHKIGEDVLTPTDFDKIDSHSINCVKNCFDSYKEILTFEDIFLPELLEHEFFYYLNFQIFTAHVILKILENEKASLVIDFTNFGDYIKKITGFKKIKHTHFVITKNAGLYHDNVRVNFQLS